MCPCLHRAFVCQIVFGISTKDWPWNQISLLLVSMYPRAEETALLAGSGLNVTRGTEAGTEHNTSYAERD
jgi:hypothetical protein